MNFFDSSAASIILAPSQLELTVSEVISATSFEFCPCPIIETMAVLSEKERPSVLDIRCGLLDTDIVGAMRTMLRPGEGQIKSLPTLLLYDEKGLKLFEDITYLEEYYLTNAEIEVLQAHAEELVKIVSAGSLVVELGSGYDLPVV